MTASAQPGYAGNAIGAAAVDDLTRVLARELEDRGITVNAVSVDVEQSDADGRVADIVANLLSDEGHRVTGHVSHPDDPAH